MLFGEGGDEGGVGLDQVGEGGGLLLVGVGELLEDGGEREVGGRGGGVVAYVFVAVAADRRFCHILRINPR